MFAGTINVSRYIQLPCARRCQLADPGPHHSCGERKAGADAHAAVYRPVRGHLTPLIFALARGGRGVDPVADGLELD